MNDGNIVTKRKKLDPYDGSYLGGDRNHWGKTVDGSAKDLIAALSRDIGMLSKGKSHKKKAKQSIGKFKEEDPEESTEDAPPVLLNDLWKLEIVKVEDFETQGELKSRFAELNNVKIEPQSQAKIYVSVDTDLGELFTTFDADKSDKKAGVDGTRHNETSLKKNDRQEPDFPNVPQTTTRKSKSQLYRNEPPPKITASTARREAQFSGQSDRKEVLGRSQRKHSRNLKHVSFVLKWTRITFHDHLPKLSSHTSLSLSSDLILF